MTRTRPPTESPSIGMPGGLTPPAAQDTTRIVLSAEEASARKKAGDRAFEDLVRRYEPMLAACARGWINTAADAEDLVEDTLIKAWQQDVIALCEGEEKRIRAYLLTTMRRCMVDQLRKEHRFGRMIADFAAFVASHRSAREAAANHTIARDFDSDCHRALMKLPLCCRQTFILVHHLGLSYDETAEVLEVTVNTVHAQLKRAKRLLRTELEAGGYGPRPVTAAGKQEDTP